MLLSMVERGRGRGREIGSLSLKLCFSSRLQGLRACIYVTWGGGGVMSMVERGRGRGGRWGA